MCTLIVLDRVVPGNPLVVASNRDEYLARAAAPPSRLGGTPGRPEFVAPQDLEAGGTWMGVNTHGVFVGLTNRPTEVRDESLRSRGLLVQDALRGSSADRVAAETGRVKDGEYNPFNLLCADGKTTWMTCQRADGIETRSLEPGVHVLCNRDLDDRTVPKIDRIHADLEDLDFSGPLRSVLDRLVAVLSDHGPAGRPTEGVCVHTPGYGTRSSALLALGDRRWRYWYADGPPCEAKYRNYTVLMDEIRHEGEMRQ